MEKTQSANPAKRDETTQQKTKSKIALWREKNPYGLGGKFINMEAVLR